MDNYQGFTQAQIKIFMNDYLLNLIINYLFLVLGSMGFWLIYRWSKILNFGHITSFGLGGYCYAILTTQTIVNPFTALFLSFILGILVNSILFWVTKINLKLNISSFSFILNIFCYFLVINSTKITNGNLGIVNIPAIPNIILALLSLVFLEYFIISSFTKSQFGIVAKSFNSQNLLSNLGINFEPSYAFVLVISGGFASVNGALSASFISYIDPSILHYGFIFTLLIIVNLAHSRLSQVFLSSFLILLIPELLRLIEIPIENLSELKNIIFDLLLLFLLYSLLNNQNSKLLSK